MTIKRIYVPSMSRPTAKLTTPYMFPNKLRDRVRVVVPQRQVADYEKAHPDLKILGHPDRVKGIGEARQWIADRVNYLGDDVLCMFDDDMTGLCRKKQISAFGTLAKVSPKEWFTVFGLWEKWLRKGFAQVGLADRATSARHTKSAWTENGRAFKALVFNSEILANNDFRFDRVTINEDIDIILQLTRNGFPQRVSTRWSFTALPEYTNPGGCADYRDDALLQREAKKLIKLHPGIVTPAPYETSKTYKKVSWVKAAEEGGLR